MRDESRFEIERAFDLLPHVIGASWTVAWYRFNKIKNPSVIEFREKTIEYFEMLEPVFNSYKGMKDFDDLNDYIIKRREKTIVDIRNGDNIEIEKRYDRYIDYG